MAESEAKQQPETVRFFCFDVRSDLKEISFFFSFFFAAEEMKENLAKNYMF